MPVCVILLVWLLHVISGTRTLSVITYEPIVATVDTKSDLGWPCIVAPNLRDTTWLCLFGHIARHTHLVAH